MTLFEAMPSLWVILTAASLFIHAVTGSRLFLLCCGGGFAAFAPAALGAGIKVQAAVFGVYCVAVGALCLSRRKIPDKPASEGAALTDINGGGGAILWRGRAVRAVCADPFVSFAKGEVLTVYRCGSCADKADANDPSGAKNSTTDPSLP